MKTQFARYLICLSVGFTATSIGTAPKSRVVASEFLASLRPEPSENLEKTASEFVTALKEKSAEAIFSQFSREGVVFGIDSDLMPWKKIKEEMGEGRSLYCLFFDTACLHRDPAFRQLTALRDQILNGRGYRLQVSVNRETKPTSGQVRVFVQGNPERRDRGEEFCNLSYEFQAGAWKVVELQYF